MIFLIKRVAALALCGAIIVTAAPGGYTAIPQTADSRLLEEHAPADREQAPVKLPMTQDRDHDVPATATSGSQLLHAAFAGRIGLDSGDAGSGEEPATTVLPRQQGPGDTSGSVPNGGPAGGGMTVTVTVADDRQLPVGDETVEQQTQPQTVTPTSYEPGVVDDVTQEVIRLVNRQRRQNGREELSTDSGLMSAAAVRARELETSYSHTRPDGSSCFTAISNRGSFGGVAENICMGYSTADRIVTAFMNSEGHRKNILGSYDSVGIAVWQDAGGKLYCAQLFGSSRSNPVVAPPVTPTPDPDPSQEIRANASLSPSAISLEVGESFQLAVNYGTADAAGYSLRFTPSGTQLSVDAGGYVTAREPGQAVVSVSILKGSQTIHILYCSVTIRSPAVTQPEPPPEPEPEPQPEPQPEPEPEPTPEPEPEPEPEPDQEEPEDED